MLIVGSSNLYFEWIRIYTIISKLQMTILSHFLLVSLKFFIDRSIHKNLSTRNQGVGVDRLSALCIKKEIPTKPPPNQESPPIDTNPG